jgi:hypothetical protein
MEGVAAEFTGPFNAEIIPYPDVSVIAGSREALAIRMDCYAPARAMMRRPGLYQSPARLQVPKMQSAVPIDGDQSCAVAEKSDIRCATGMSCQRGESRTAFYVPYDDDLVRRSGCQALSIGAECDAPDQVLADGDFAFESTARRVPHEDPPVGQSGGQASAVRGLGGARKRRLAALNLLHERTRLQIPQPQTRLARRRELSAGDDVALGQIADCREHMCALVRSNGGEFISSKGDDVLSIFRDTAGAFRAASQMRIQSGLPISFHAGLHYGPIRAGNDIYGDTVNLTARLAGIANPGEVL